MYQVILTHAFMSKIDNVRPSQLGVSVRRCSAYERRQRDYPPRAERDPSDLARLAFGQGKPTTQHLSCGTLPIIHAQRHKKHAALTLLVDYVEAWMFAN